MNILIIKVGALGDVVRSSFIAQALKDKYKEKNPKIFWITDKKAMPLFINNPYVDYKIPLDKKEKLRGINFDIVVNLEEGEEECKFVSSIKTKKLIGFYYEDGKIIPTKSAKEWYDMSALGKKPKNDILKKKNKKTHRQIISEIVGVNSKKYEPFLRLTNKQRGFAERFFRRNNLSRKKLVVGLNLGSADRWPKSLSIEKSVKLAEMLYKEFDVDILLFGGPNEIERNREIIKLAKAPIISAGCGNDLIEFPALVSMCNLFITTDSLGLHIALVLKRKTICLIGPTSATELDMYDIGEKVVAKSKCVCCYKKDCKSMEKIDLKEIVKDAKKLLKQKVTLVITAFKEPKTIGKAIESALTQNVDDYEIIVSAPDKETLDVARKYAKKDKRLKIYKDPGKGKSHALNLLFKIIKTDILVLTDGDVYMGKNAIKEIVSLFMNPEIGCATGRPVPIESKKTKYGYWANFLFEAAHKMRKEAYLNNEFIECSGYLFAFRKKEIEKIPKDVAEDTIIPYYFWEKGYRIGYAENAKVYVKNVDNWDDWIKQKTRTSKAHETLNKYVNTRNTPRVKTFSNEAKGINWAVRYPKGGKELLWTFELVLARFYMWMKVFKDTKLKKKHYQDAWERVESTKYDKYNNNLL